MPDAGHRNATGTRGCASGRSRFDESPGIVEGAGAAPGVVVGAGAGVGTRDLNPWAGESACPTAHVNSFMEETTPRCRLEWWFGYSAGFERPGGDRGLPTRGLGRVPCAV